MEDTESIKLCQLETLISLSEIIYFIGCKSNLHPLSDNASLTAIMEMIIVLEVGSVRQIRDICVMSVLSRLPGHDVNQKSIIPPQN
jgi:hypothetical protein